MAADRLWPARQTRGWPPRAGRQGAGAWTSCAGSPGRSPGRRCRAGLITVRLPALVCKQIDVLGDHAGHHAWRARVRPARG